MYEIYAMWIYPWFQSADPNIYRDKGGRVERLLACTLPTKTTTSQLTAEQPWARKTQNYKMIFYTKDKEETKRQ